MKIPKSEDRRKLKFFSEEMVTSEGWDELQTQVKSYMQRHGLTPSQVTVDSEASEDGYGSIGSSMWIRGQRMETEEEKDARIKKWVEDQAEQKKLKEIREKEEWERIKPHVKRLAKKYGE